MSFGVGIGDPAMLIEKFRLEVAGVENGKGIQGTATNSLLGVEDFLSQQKFPGQVTPSY